MPYLKLCMMVCQILRIRESLLQRSLKSIYDRFSGRSNEAMIRLVMDDDVVHDCHHKGENQCKGFARFFFCRGNVCYGLCTACSIHEVCHIRLGNLSEISKEDFEIRSY